MKKKYNIDKQAILDYQTVMHNLRNYNQPRDKLTKLLRDGELVRVKKGLYLSGESYTKNTYSREVLANLIFGPSYLSLEYALAYYQLIPEQVMVLTSVTTQREKMFNTPAGVYTYKHLPLACYAVGINKVRSAKGNYLIACKEKALLDKIYFTRGIFTLKHLRELLFADLRIEESALVALEPNILLALAKKMQKKSIELCLQLIRELK